MKHTISKSIFVVFAILKCTATTVLECQSPFISSALTCQQFKPIASELVKIYTTTLPIMLTNSTDDFDKQVFTHSMTTFYNETLDGFKKLVSDEPVALLGKSFQVTYSVTYFYEALNATSNNEKIENTIANISFISTALQKDVNFTMLYHVNSGEVLTFKENSICTQVSCKDSPYSECVESGLDVCCQSLCCTTDYCKNNGHCFHSDTFASPSCRCVNHYNYWYVGSQCETYLHIWMLILVSLIFALILIFIVIFFVYKLSRLQHKSLDEIRNEVNVKKNAKPSSLTIKLKNFFWSFKARCLACCLKAKDSVGSEKLHENQPHAAAPPPQMSTTTYSDQKPPPIPLPRTFITSTANSFHNTSLDEEESLHETTSQSSFDDQDQQQSSYTPHYEDVPDEIEVAPEEEQIYYEPPFDETSFNESSHNTSTYSTRSGDFYLEPCPMVTTV